jgi:hypothetical protein
MASGREGLGLLFRDPCVDRAQFRPGVSVPTILHCSRRTLRAEGKMAATGYELPNIAMVDDDSDDDSDDEGEEA